VYVLFSVATCTLAVFLEWKLKEGGDAAHAAGFVNSQPFFFLISLKPKVE